MTRFRLVLSSVLIFAFVAAIAAHAGRGAAAETSAGVPARSFEFTYQVHVPASTDSTAPTHLWIPLPQSASGFDVIVRFAATRREHLVPLTQGVYPATKPDPMLQRYLQPDKLVPLNSTIAELAKEQTAGATTPLDTARRIYDYVVATMRYDKTGEGWGRGDAVWACTSKRGNCTDFHSLFIGMMRSSGIPARFEIGFPLPENKTEGDISGYHCWAEFYLAGIGWVPVDASEAWKNPAKRDFFFGAHDTNRVFFTYGRDIRLSPDQKGDPLNYFIYPYAETNGQPVKNLQTHFSFRDVSSAQPAVAGR
jgi:transglutaminase-like putative cysteine protease